MNTYVKSASAPNLSLPLIVIAAVLSISTGLLSKIAYSQETATTPAAETAADELSANEIETLVAPIALYPDELISIVLPASTFPLEIVQAARFLEK